MRKLASVIALLAVLGTSHVPVALADDVEVRGCQADGVIAASALESKPICNEMAKYIDVGVGYVAKPNPGNYISITIDSFRSASPTVTIATLASGQSYVASSTPLVNQPVAEKLVATSTPMSNTNCGAPSYFLANGWRPQQPLKWYYNPTNEPASNSLIRIGEGFQTWQAGANRCNTTIIPNGVATSYQGLTGDSPSGMLVPSSGNSAIFDLACAVSLPSKRVIGWVNLLDLAAGVTCHYGVIGNSQSDISTISLNSAYPWYTTFDQSYCLNQADLKGVATHEEGHMLGLDHYAHNGQVMKPSGGACDMNMRGLGYGDVHGIATVIP
jgi:hypothetical protein